MVNSSDPVQELINEFLMIKTEPNGDGYCSAAELADKLGCSRKLALLKLKTLEDTGRLECTYRMTKNIAGRACVIPVYRVKQTQSAPAQPVQPAPSVEQKKTETEKPKRKRTRRTKS